MSTQKLLGSLYPARSVVQPWVSRMSFRAQAVLLSALRGCDGKPKEDASKKLTRIMRGHMLLPADPNDNAPGSFMNDTVEQSYIDAWVKDLDHYPVHWLLHFAHAAHLIYYYHPDIEVCRWWYSVYEKICGALHLQPETDLQIKVRLRDVQREEEDA